MRCLLLNGCNAEGPEDERAVGVPTEGPQFHFHEFKNLNLTHTITDLPVNQQLLQPPRVVHE